MLPSILEKPFPANWERTDSTDVLLEYRALIKNCPFSYEQLKKENEGQLTRYTYRLQVQTGLSNQQMVPTNWEHTVDIYAPVSSIYKTALMVVNNGNSLPYAQPTDYSESLLRQIAQQTQTMVVSIAQVPNQGLTYLDDGGVRREDYSVAKSWQLFMNDPQSCVFMPLCLPMMGSVIKAMDLVNEVMPDNEAGSIIEGFIVTGISKRGWAVWLTKLIDPRVKAIVPIAAEILDLSALIERTRDSLSGDWPIAFTPYLIEGIIQRRHTPAFSTLMAVEDPLCYLQTPLAHRLSETIYYISASGDDFFWPDSLSYALAKATTLAKSLVARAIPNCNHYEVKNAVSSSLIPFINRWQAEKIMPTVSILPVDTMASGKILHLSEKPQKIVIWTANNPEIRDFRKNSGIIYYAYSVDIIAECSDNKYPLPLLHPLQCGWTASFVEIQFYDAMWVTTPIIIEPEGYPEKLCASVKNPETIANLHQLTQIMASTMPSSSANRMKTMRSGSTNTHQLLYRTASNFEKQP